jgi:hypothetical protein
VTRSETSNSNGNLTCVAVSAWGERGKDGINLAHDLGFLVDLSSPEESDFMHRQVAVRLLSSSF